MNAHPLAVAVFFLTLLLTFGTAIYARTRAEHGSSEEDLAGRSLNKWLIGLSAGTTGNSGFIVTGAVGLGYSGGAQWLLLPIGWLVGDLIYWAIFPDKINRLARETQAVTLPELITHGLDGKAVRTMAVLVALILVTFLSVYTAAQWLAGQKFLGTIFNMTPANSLIGFGFVIALYSAIGGFRGSVYVDVLQSVIRIGGTVLALWAVTTAALAMGPSFSRNITAAGPDFLNPLASNGLFGAVGMALGYAGASLGFGLGQPQIVTRYMAGRDPLETKSARWIYIGFLQSTWIAMTVFGMILRGVQPGISDPETGLSVFFLQNVGAIATGIIFADVFATIASTSNGLLVAISQTLRRDILGMRHTRAFSTFAITLALGLITVGLSLVLPGNVFSLAIAAVSQIGAGVGAAVLIRVLGLKHTATSLLAAIGCGTATAAAWVFFGLSGYFNETLPGIAVTLLVNLSVTGATVRTPKTLNE